MTIKESLKKIYKAFSGGTDSTSKSISGILNDISTVAGSGGSGGGGIFLVNIVLDEDTNYTTDKTFREMLDASNNGMLVMGVDSTEENITAISTLCTFDTHNEISSGEYGYQAIFQGDHTYNLKTLDIDGYPNDSFGM